jgi:hypothetical protein
VKTAYEGDDAMKFLRMFSIVYVLLSALALPETEYKTEQVIQVHCEEATGCFRLLEQALATAPEGAVVQISSGIYYEHALVITKSVRLQGVQEIGAHLPIITAVDQGPLLTVPSSPKPISVTIENLTLQNLVLSGLGLLVQGASQSTSTSFPEVVLRGSWLFAADRAISVQGKARLRLQESSIQAGNLPIEAQYGSHLIAIDNTITLSWPNEPLAPIGVILLQDVEAVFEKNSISPQITAPRPQVPFGILAGGGKYSFSENEIQQVGVGVILVGKTNAAFNNNRIHDNMIGIALELPPCIPNPDPEIRFDGVITGSGNQLANNSKGDLCPADYPWPEGFRK